MLKYNRLFILDAVTTKYHDILWYLLPYTKIQFAVSVCAAHIAHVDVSVCTSGLLRNIENTAGFTCCGCVFVRVSMERFHDATIQIQGGGAAPPSADPEFRTTESSAHLPSVSRQPAEVQQAHADDWESLLTTATSTFYSICKIKMSILALRGWHSYNAIQCIWQILVKTAFFSTSTGKCSFVFIWINTRLLSHIVTQCAVLL